MSMTDQLREAVARVTAYLDAMDETAARRVAAGLDDQYADEVHVYNLHDLRRSDLRTLLAAVPAPEPPLVWVGCPRDTAWPSVTYHQHLVPEGEHSSLCGCSASDPDVWERYRFHRRPKCPVCIEEARTRGLVAP